MSNIKSTSSSPSASASQFKESIQNIQAFHQCSSLAFIKQTSSNFLIWCSQVLPLICSLRGMHHNMNIERPVVEITID